MKIQGFFLLALAAIVAAKTYDNYKVFSVMPKTEKQLEFLKNLRVEYNLDFWTEPRGVGVPFDVMIAPDQVHLIHRMHSADILGKIKIRDVQHVIDSQRNSKIQPRQANPNLRLDHSDYRDLDGIYKVLDDFAANSDLVTVYEPTQTTEEGRKFKVAQVSNDDGSSKPVIWIDCGIHAREWIAPATCQYILDMLTSSDADAQSLLSMYDFHVMPSVNPDGYEYTWNSERLWRKNRHHYGLCYGTDPNRNFDSDFGGPGTSDSPCSDIYHGESAFSEAESKAVRDSLLALSGRVKAYFTLHSYSQLWMTPYGYTYALPSNYDEQNRVAKVGVDALKAVHGKTFTHGNIASTIYEAAGGSSDWAYDAEGIQYAFALELRDTGSYGFLLPKEQIIPVGEETYAGIVAAINAME